MQSTNLSLQPAHPTNTVISEIMSEVATGLRAFLERTLPPIRADWWPALVTANLTEQQQYNLKYRRSDTLDSLDLASLLRVFKCNFDDIDQRVGLPWGLRNWLKEMQGIRNKYAHASGEPATVEDQWRDLDTTQRFAASIGANQKLLNTLAHRKTCLLQPGTSAPQTDRSAISDTPIHADLLPDDEAVLKFEPPKSGCVVLVFPPSPSNRFVATSTATH